MTIDAVEDDEHKMDGPFDPGHTRALQLANEVMQRIVQLEIPPGSAITEGELASEHDISKPTAREALQWVMFQGLVTPRRGAGYIVDPITLRDAKDLLQWWRVNFVQATALAASAGIPEHAKQWRKAIAERGNSTDGDADQTEFMHDFAIATLCPNRAFTRSITILWPALARLENLARRGGSLRAEPGVVEIFDAIEARDVELATQLATDRHADIEFKIIDALINLRAVQDANLAAPVG